MSVCVGMHKLKRGKTAAQQAKWELQANAALANESASEDDSLSEASVQLRPQTAVVRAMLMPCLTGMCFPADCGSQQSI